MSSIKCVACGHRNLHATEQSKCSNCGASLALASFNAQVDLNKEGLSLSVSPPTSDIRASQRQPNVLSSVMGTVQSSQDTRQSLPSQNTSSPSSKRWVKERRQEIIPANQSARVVQETHHQVEPYQQREISTKVEQNPFENALDLFPSPYGADERSSPMIVQNPLPPSTSPQPLWLLAELPRGYRCRPDVAGTLINVQGQMEEYHSFDVIGAIIKLLADMLWPSSAASDVSQRREKDQVFMTTLRVRTADGTQKDARVMGHLTSASVTLGDTILLWGHKRGGALLVRRGYNYTSKSKITTRATSSSLAFFIILAIMLVAMIALLYWRYFPLFSFSHH